VNLSAIVVDEVTLIGSRCGPFEPALQLLESGQIDTASMVSARFGLSDGSAAFQEAGESGMLKVVLEPD
jgi:threonine dehydrogenase-like Zn-dependent dehydrogenase